MRLILAGIALAAASATSLAADLPVRSAAPAPVFAAPTFSWTGFYVGANAGWVGTKTKSSPGYYDRADPTCWYWACDDSFSSDASGFIGGVQAGYNHQIGSLVLGIEGDMAWTSASSSYRNANFDADYYEGSSLDALGTLRLRLGFAFDRTLVYATGGLAFGRLKSSWIDFSKDFYVARGSAWNTGWTVGGGVEYAFSGNWSGRIEALYFDLGDTTASGPGAEFDNGIWKKFDNTGWTVRAGVNYRFGAAATRPVVARY